MHSSIPLGWYLSSNHDYYQPCKSKSHPWLSLSLSKKNYLFEHMKELLHGSHFFHGRGGGGGG